MLEHLAERSNRKVIDELTAICVVLLEVDVGSSSWLWASLAVLDTGFVSCCVDPAAVSLAFLALCLLYKTAFS